MKIIDVPIYDDDGSITATFKATPDEAQMLLQFAVNFLTSAGLSVRAMVKKAHAAKAVEEEEDDYDQLNLFNPTQTND